MFGFGLFGLDLVVLETLLCILLRASEELCGDLGLGGLEGLVSGLAHDEVLIGRGGILGVEGEAGVGVVAIELPVARFDCLLLFHLTHIHADTVVDAGGVADQQGRSVVGFRLGDRLEKLRLACAHCALCDVDVAVAHRHHAEVLLLGALTCGRELGDGAGRRGLGGLTAGVGIDLGIEHKDVDVFVLSEDVVQTAVTDIVSPAVAADDPEGLLDDAVAVLIDGLEDALELALGCLDGGGESGLDLGRALLGYGNALHVGAPLLEGGFELGGAAQLDGLVHIGGQLFAASLVCEEHAVTELCVILEQGVGPSGTFALGVLGVRADGSAAAVDGGAARCVGDDHAVAEQLRDELDVRRFAAARARAGELEERLRELAVLGVGGRNVLDGDGHGVSPVVLFRLDGLFDVHHLERLTRSGADVRAARAARAVHGGDLHSELHALEAVGGLGHEGLGRGLGLFLGHQHGADAGVRADVRALVALYALGDVPHGNGGCGAALFESGRAGGNAAVRAHHGYGQLVAFLHVADGDEFVVILIVLGFRGNGRDGARLDGGPGCGDLDLAQLADGHVDGVAVGLDDLGTLLAVGLLDGLLHVAFRLGVRYDVGYLEERRLKNHVLALGAAGLGRDVQSVDGIHLDLLLGEQVLHGRGKLGVELLVRPLAVEQEGAALFERGDHVVHRDVSGLVASHEIRLVDEVLGMDGLIAETQVRQREAARLLGVVFEIALRVLVGVVADDLDAVLVRTHGAVAAEAVELAAHGGLGSGVDELGVGDGRVGHVVVDTDGEVVLGLVLLELGVDGVDHGRRELLAAQTVAAAHRLDGPARFGERRADVEVERLAQATGLLGTVEHGQLLAGSGDRAHEILDGEGTVQTHLDHADFLALCREVVDGLLNGLRAAAHDDDHAVGVRSSVVLIELVLPAGELGNGLHLLLDYLGNGLIVLVDGLSALEIDVGVLSGTLLLGVLGIERAVLEIAYLIHVDEGLHLVVFDRVDLADFVAGTETVEEVQERHLALQRGKVRDEREVHDLLDAVGAQHREARLTSAHHV